MEPIWLGLAGQSITRTARNAAQSIAEPFAAVLDSAAELLAGQPPQESDLTSTTVKNNPHTQLLAEVLTGHPLVGDDRSLGVDDIRLEADSLEARLAENIERVLSNLDLRVGDAIPLRISPLDGSLEITGDVPHAAEIEKELAKDPTIATDFRRLSALQSLVSAADAHTEFAEAYSADPYAAVQEFAHLFRTEPAASLIQRPLSAEIRFER